MKIFRLLLIFFSINSFSQSEFVGQYIIHDGGRDIPNSYLYILPNDTYYLISLDYITTGKWKQIDKKNIKLFGNKENEIPILVYGSYKRNLSEIKIDVSNLPNAHGFIDFTSDINSKNKLIPIFNESPNCTDSDFIISKKINEVKWMRIAVPENPEFANEITTYPYHVINYTFEIDKKFNYYTVGFDKNALIENIDLIISKRKNSYLLNNNVELEKNNLTESDIEKFLANIKLYQQEKNAKAKGTKIAPIKNEKVVISEPSKSAPYFIAECEKTKINYDLPIVNRENGFYEVSNFKKNQTTLFNYKLAKNPSIQIADIEKVEKKLSEYFSTFEIEITLNETGRIKFEKLTQNNLDQPLAIVIDKKIVLAPIVTSVISTGIISIYGQFTESEIDNFIVALQKDK